MTVNPSLVVLALLIIQVACSFAPEKLKWWQTAIIYQIYPRSFKDSDGDGIGDLAGITSKLAYLKELGVQGIWLSPIYPSPQLDAGYDISNFIDVDSTYGSLKDFDNMVKEAHRLGLKVIMDIVPNHTSDQHPWFIASEDPDHPLHAEYKDYYNWHPGKIGPDGKKQVPNNWISIFRGSAWSYSEKRGMYYFHNFHKKQPDLDLRNRNVVKQISEVLRFWMNRQVDGFRFDAVAHLFQDPEFKNSPVSGITDDKDHPLYLVIKDHTQHRHEIYDVVREWYEVVNKRKDAERVVMSEAYAPMEDVMKYYGTKEQPATSFPFNFFLITETNRDSDAKQFAKVINEWMDNMIDGRWPNWVLGNHDRNRTASRYRPELVDALNMLILSLPGTAVTYYGEELGMEDMLISWEDTQDPQALSLGRERYLEMSRDPCRTPMQWDYTISAGFSKNPVTWLPVNPNYRELNAKNQSSKRSHYSIYRQMAELRKTRTLQRGDVKVTERQGLLIVERELQNEPTYTLVVNFQNTKGQLFNQNHSMKVFASSLNSGFKDGAMMRKRMTIQPYSAVMFQPIPIECRMKYQKSSQAQRERRTRGGRNWSLSNKKEQGSRNCFHIFNTQKRIDTIVNNYGTLLDKFSCICF